MSTVPACPVAEELSQAVARNELELPVMPAWASKVQRMLDDINVSAAQIVAALARDPAFVAQLIRTANSALYAGKPKVDNVNAAVSRLGYKMLRNLVVSAALSQLAMPKQPPLRRLLDEFWLHSREVAATSYVLAKSQKHLSPDHALLAGLIHDIGRLPLLLYIEHKGLQMEEAVMSMLLNKCSAVLGERLLQSWEFPPELVEIPVSHEDLFRTADAKMASYTDIVTVANMLTRASAKVVDWEKLSAVQRLGLAPELYREFFERFERELASARAMFA